MHNKVNRKERKKDHTICSICGGLGMQYIFHAMFDTVIGLQGTFVGYGKYGGISFIDASYYQTCGVCYSNSKIKTKLLSKVDSNTYGSSTFKNSINSSNVKDMKFYLKPNNKAMVCFSSEKIGYGNNAYEPQIKSNYA